LLQPGRVRSGLIIRHPGSALAVAAMTVALLAPPLVTYEAMWEIAAALGYVAAAAAVLCVLTRPGSGAALTAYRFTLHRAAGDALLLLGLLHVAVMVAADPFMLDYLGWMMPLHVLVGGVAIVLLALVILGREPALRARPRWLGGVGLPRLGGPRRRPAGRFARPSVVDPPHRHLALPARRRCTRPSAGFRGGHAHHRPARSRPDLAGAGGAAGSGGASLARGPGDSARGFPRRPRRGRIVAGLSA